MAPFRNPLPTFPPKALFAFLFVLVLAGCAPLTRTEQAEHAGRVTLQSGDSLGQTFTARYGGLEGISLFLEPAKNGADEAAGRLRLHLRSAPDATADLRTAELDLAQVTSPGYYRFQFQAIPASAFQDYYLSLSLEAANTGVQAATAAGEAYLDGAMYLNGQSQDRQSSFRLLYDPAQAGQALAGEALTWLGWLGMGLLLFVLPGWAVAGWLWRGWAAHTWLEKLGLAVGLSLALYPLLFLWTGLAGLRLGPLYAWLPLALGAAGAALLVIRRKAPPSNQPTTHPPHLLPDLALLFTLALAFAVRFWAVRGLAAPMWGDSVQHTVIAQLLVDHGGLFDSWLPYANLTTFTYHFGFHTLAAAFYWIAQPLGGLSMAQSVLWTGQILNGLAALALYPLAMRLTGSRWAAAGAVLLAGLLFPNPMDYANWGRYTQLAGQAILPGAVYLAWEGLAGPEYSLLDWLRRRKTPEAPRPFGLLALGWIAFGGLALTHYRVLIFAVLFVAAYFALEARRGKALALVVQAGALGVGGGLLFLPWFGRVFSGKIMGLLGYHLTTAAGQVAESIQQYNAIGDIFAYLPAAAWILLVLAAGLGLWRREKGVALVGLWWLLVLLAANPQWLGLPGAGAIGSFTVMIAAYIPAALLVAAPLAWLEARRPAPAWLPLLLLAAFVGAGLWGVRPRLADVKPAQGVLFTRPDARAAAWIRANTPPEARFLVNAFFSFGGTIAVGSDGGWWLPLAAGRANTLPPINYTTEQGASPDDIQSVNELAQAVIQKGATDPGVLDLLARRQVSYVYIGQRQGQANNPGVPVLDPQALLASPAFRLVYHQDRVWIFQVEQR